MLWGALAGMAGKAISDIFGNDDTQDLLDANKKKQGILSNWGNTELQRSGNWLQSAIGDNQKMQRDEQADIHRKSKEYEHELFSSLAADGDRGRANALLGDVGSYAETKRRNALIAATLAGNKNIADAKAKRFQFDSGVNSQVAQGMSNLFGEYGEINSNDGNLADSLGSILGAANTFSGLSGAFQKGKQVTNDNPQWTT